ncbi:uncharacterized protein LOC114522552 [Dendronephthya gigantea]|uniref:uncharacterized protein LOC114522552 n=1 Tax=Dendronephthya gigantea TaxID=151771 RepID=UPI001068DA89|nr:uncharacterized protein LOC114522552 [Dendronephthya gigantea]
MEDSNDIQGHLSQNARCWEPTVRLEFNPNTGKLGVSTSKCRDSKDLPICMLPSGKLVRGLQMAAKGFFGGEFVAGTDRMVITPRSSDKNEVSVTTMHISCKCDTYNDGHNYGGVIVYQYNGKSEWRTANNTHCKSGYIVIQDTDREDVKKWKNEPGQVHGAVYRNAFGESVNDAEVVGEGFAIRNETFEMNSGVFNNPKDSPFHDRRRRMHELSEYCVRKIVESWANAGPGWLEKGRNFAVEAQFKSHKSRRTDKRVARVNFFGAKTLVKAGH